MIFLDIFLDIFFQIHVNMLFLYVYNLHEHFIQLYLKS